MKASLLPDSATTTEGAARPTVVALAMRDGALCAALAARLALERDFVVLPWPTDFAPVGRWVEHNPADVLLLEERLVRQLTPQPLPLSHRVLIVADRVCTALAEQVVRHRFQGFLLAATAADTCVKAIRTVKRGETWIPRELLVELLSEKLRADGERSFEVDGAKLTHRETQIVAYVRRGFANKQIAESLAICEDTVKKHLRNAFMKLGVRRRSEIMTRDRRLLVG